MGRGTGKGERGNEGMGHGKEDREKETCWDMGMGTEKVGIGNGKKKRGNVGKRKGGTWKTEKETRKQSIINIVSYQPTMKTIN